MNRKHIFRIARKEFLEHRVRLLLIMFSLPVMSGIFLMPQIVTQTPFLDDLIQRVEPFYPGTDPLLKRQMILLDFQLPLYVLVPAFACPFFGILESIIGEKDARTLEGLLVLPVSFWDILLGKMTTNIAGAISVSWFAYLYHLVILWIAAGTDMVSHMLSFDWLLILLLMVPALTYLFSMTAMLISMRVNKIQTAVNIASIILTPFFLVLTGIGTGFIQVDTARLLVFGGILGTMSALLTVFARYLFSAEYLVLRTHA